ncbi:MAG TPA: hypothetical protein VFF15_04450 [Flavobacteriaceae bacterium]|nr:hypothetical protein [Flavobacteriaceae bacterium]
MKKQKTKQYLILGILFFLPVTFLLFLYPAKHNYTPLDTVKTQIEELRDFAGNPENIALTNHITVVGFLGKNPLDNAVAASNIKELVYDKFKGFKTFQIVMLAPLGAEAQAQKLHEEIGRYEPLNYWHYVYGSEAQIKAFYASLSTKENLNENLYTPQIFIVDKELNQRGRQDDRNKKEVKLDKPQVYLPSYNAIEVAEIKNKFGEDLRVLFTEYRQKRKGDFDSTQRRENDIKPDHE